MIKLTLSSLRVSSRPFSLTPIVTLRDSSSRWLLEAWLRLRCCCCWWWLRRRKLFFKALSLRATVREPLGLLTYWKVNLPRRDRWSVGDSTVSPARRRSRAFPPKNVFLLSPSIYLWPSSSSSYAFSSCSSTLLVIRQTRRDITGKVREQTALAEILKRQSPSTFTKSNSLYRRLLRRGASTLGVSASSRLNPKP